MDYAEAFVAAIDPAGTGVGPFEFQYVDPAQEGVNGSNY